MPDILTLKPLIEQYCRQYQPHASVVHISSLWCWKDYFDFELQEIEGVLVVIAKTPSTAFVYWPLLGPINQIIIAEIFRQLKAVNPHTARLDCILAQDQRQYEQCGVIIKPKSPEYIYHKEDIIAYKGNAYKSQRHDVNQVIKQYSPQVRVFEDDDINDCLSLYREWAMIKKQSTTDIIAQTMIDENLLVHQLAMQDYRQIDLHGIVIEIDKQIKAYSFGFSLNDRTFVVLLEITDLTISGLGAYVFNQMCQQPIWRSKRFVNTMDDFGLPQLTQVKNAYHPCLTQMLYTGILP